jgi:ribosomal protein L32
MKTTEKGETRTAAEKWQRMKNPSHPEDWGLTLSESEMRSFPEGRAILCRFRRDQRLAIRMGVTMATLGFCFSEQIAILRQRVCQHNFLTLDVER